MGVDVHVLVMPGEDPGPIMAQLRTEPVRAVTHPGIAGAIGRARAEAIRAGRNEWVSWVDPDDRIEPGLYSRLLSLARPGVNLVHAWEQEHWPDGRSKINPWPHHAFLARRTAVAPLLDRMDGLWPEWREVAALKPTAVLRRVGYHWVRRYGSATLPALEPGHTPE